MPPLSSLAPPPSLSSVLSHSSLPFYNPPLLSFSLSIMAKNSCIQKERRNERERKRVNQVNQGFNQLRARIEQVSLNKKLSKADTLREATRYIAHLKELLKNGSSVPQNTYTVAHEKSSGYPSDESFNSHSPIEYKVDQNQLNQIHYYISHDSQ